MEYWRIKIKDEEGKRTRKEKWREWFKNVMTKDKAAKIITNEINSRAKLNKADHI